MWMIINGRFDDVNLFVFLILTLLSGFLEL